MKKRLIFTLLILCQFSLIRSQVNINITALPPFTPFLSDYLSPAKLNDVSVSIFNSNPQEVRLKFKFYLRNISKGTYIGIKENVAPANPFILNANEFKIITVSDIKNLYGNLGLESFDVQGIDVLRIIADGNIPDGYYELCVQAFDFDAPGFSKPMSGSAPGGCFSFEILYADPPTDIRCDNEILNYSFGGAVPEIVTPAGTQMHTLSFTAPTPAMSSNYQYELFIFDETSLNPRQMSEVQILQALNTLQPYIKKTGNLSTFFLDAGDLPLALNKNYYVYITATDLNNLSLFKNKGVSAMHAFKLINQDKPVIQAPTLGSALCNRTDVGEIEKLNFQLTVPETQMGYEKLNANMDVRFRILKFNALAQTPDDVFNTNVGILVKDTIIENNGLVFPEEYKLGTLTSIDQNYFDFQYVIGAQIILKSEIQNQFTLINNGISSQVCKFTSAGNRLNARPPATPPLSQIELSQVYPLEGDTLPFQYPPVVIHYTPQDTQILAVFSRFDGDLEPNPSYRHFIFNPSKPASAELKALSLDTLYKHIANLLETEAQNQLRGDFSGSLGAQALQLLESNSQLAYSEFRPFAGQDLPLGGPLAVKNKIARRMLDFSANAQLLGSNLLFTPNFQKTLILYPQRNNVHWNATVGVYTKNTPDPIQAQRYLDAFTLNNLQGTYPTNELVTKGLTTYSGSFNVGMKTPVISKLNGRTFDMGEINFTLVPSLKPNKLFPSDVSTAAWKGLKLLQVAQQLNIEIASDKQFQNIVKVVQHPIVRTYSIPEDINKINDDLYNSIQLSTSIIAPGKYFWRATWSNITLDTTLYQQNPQTVSYFRTVFEQMAAIELLGGSLPTRNADSLLLARLNYKFSAIDSFSVRGTQSAPASNCGLQCNVPADSLTGAPVTNIAPNQEVTVGKFTMKITTIQFSGNLASGTGTIKVPFFGKPVLVNFSRAQFNNKMRMIAGEAKVPNTPIGALDGLQGGSMLEKLNQYVHIESGINETIYNYFSSANNIVSNVFSNNPVSMPIGISQEIDDKQYTLSITDLSFLPSGTSGNLVMILPFPSTQNPYIGFKLSNICLNPEGFANTLQQGKLEMLKSIKTPLFGMPDLELTLLGSTENTPGTSVEWDCRGFKSINIMGKLKIPKSILVLPTRQGLDTNIVANFSVTGAQSMENWIATVGINGKFELAQLPGWTMGVNSASLDFSTLDNPPGLTFPANYNAQFANHLWQGLHLGEIAIDLPKEFTKNTSGNEQKIGFVARNLLLDGSGISGRIAATQIVSLAEGKLGSWATSIAEIGIDLTSNTLSGASINGRMQVPLIDSSLGYTMALSFPPNSLEPDYNVSVTLGNELPIPMLFAKVNLNNTSSISLVKKGAGLSSAVLKANLSGDISIGGDNVAGVKDLRFGQLPFEGLEITSSITKPDSFGFSLAKLGGIAVSKLVNQAPAGSANANNTPAAPSNDIQKFGGFPITFSDFGIDQFDGKCLIETDNAAPAGLRFGVKFKVSVNVATSPDGSGIGGSTTIGLYGNLDLNKLTQKKLLAFRFAGINIDTIRIAAKISGVMDISGAIAFLKNHPVYGDGFAGFVSANIQPGFTVAISGMFGEKNRSRYFFIDGQVDFPLTPVPIDFGVNVLYVNGFGGGGWYHMDRQMGNPQAGSGLGTSASGATFIPNPNTLFGFEGRLNLTGPPGSNIYGQVRLFAELSTAGALKTLGFGGDIWFLTAQKKDASLFIGGEVVIKLLEKKIEGKMIANVNVANSVRGVKPVTANNTTFYQAGEVNFKLDFTNGTWYIKMGDPFVANGKLGLALYANNAELFRIGGYFAMGNELGGLPPIPKEINDAFLANGKTLSRTPLPANTGNNKFRINMGAELSIPPKELNAGPLYAKIGGMVAMDASLALLGSNVCAGRNGINGWYANGQGYMYVLADAGINVNSPVYTGKISIGQISAAAVLNAGLMNPYFFNGSFIANFNLMGGLISGSKNFDFKYNEVAGCSPNASNTLGAGQLVASVLPAKNTTDVSIGIEPTIALNYKIGATTKYTIVNNSGNTEDRYFKLAYDNVQLKGTKNRKITVITSDDKFDLRIVPDSFLEPNQLHTFKIRIYALATDNNGVSQGPLKKNNREVDSTITLTFTTESTPSVIGDHLIKSCNPKKGTRYYTLGDSRNGNITFTRADASALFPPKSITLPGKPPIPQIKYYVQFSNISNSNDTVSVPITISGDKVNFSIPQKVTQERIYSVRIIRERIPNLLLNNSMVSGLNVSDLGSNNFGSSNTVNAQQQAIGTNTGAGGNQVRYTGNLPDLDGINVRNRNSTLVQEGRLIMMSFIFGTSKFNTMKDKIQQLQLIDNSVPLRTDTVQLAMSTGEPFELFDVQNGLFSNIYTVLNRTNPIDSWYYSQYRKNVVDNYNQIRNIIAGYSAITPVYSTAPGMRFNIDYHILGPLPQMPQYIFDYRNMVRLSNNYHTNLVSNQSIILNNTITQMTLSNFELSMSELDGGPLAGRGNGRIEPDLSRLNQQDPAAPPPPPPAKGTRLNVKVSDFAVAHAHYQTMVQCATAIKNSTSAFNRLSNSKKALINDIIAGKKRPAYPSASYNFKYTLVPFDLPCTTPNQLLGEIPTGNCKSFLFRQASWMDGILATMASGQAVNLTFVTTTF